MKKFLIAIFLILIIGFGIVGFTQTTSKSNDTIDQNMSSVTIHS